MSYFWQADAEHVGLSISELGRAYARSGRGELTWPLFAGTAIALGFPQADVARACEHAIERRTVALETYRQRA